MQSVLEKIRDAVGYDSLYRRRGVKTETMGEVWVTMFYRLRRRTILLGLGDRQRSEAGQSTYHFPTRGTSPSWPKGPRQRSTWQPSQRPLPFRSKNHSP